MNSLSGAVIEFAIAFSKALPRQESESNAFFSPWSIVQGFAMVLAGASGRTKDEIVKAMKLENVPDEEFNHEMEGLSSALRKACLTKTSLEIANKMWINTGFHILESYSTILRATFEVEAGEVNFATNAQGATMEINNWVEEKTNGKINKLFPDGSLDNMTRLVLSNAVYFKGMWDQPFNVNATRKGKFFVSEKKTIDVQVMSVSGYFSCHYDRELGATIIELPYTEKSFSMILVLPTEKFGLADVEQKIKPEAVAKWDLNHQSKIEIFVPKFKLSQTLELKHILESMGMCDAFSVQSANLSGITGTQDLYVSCAFHKAFVEVDEEGTVAAAATGIGINARSRIQQIRVDHPFLVMIRENSTACVLFWGKVFNPSQSNNTD